MRCEESRKRFTLVEYFLVVFVVVVFVVVKRLSLLLLETELLLSCAMMFSYFFSWRHVARAHPVTSSGSRGAIAPAGDDVTRGVADWCRPCDNEVERDEMESLENATHDLQMAIRETRRLARNLQRFTMVRNITLKLERVRRLQ